MPRRILNFLCLERAGLAQIGEALLQGYEANIDLTAFKEAKYGRTFPWLEHAGAAK